MVSLNNKFIAPCTDGKYLEPSIMVAMRSRRYPVTNVIANDMPLMDLGVPLELDQNQLSDLEPSTDRTLGEASDIELCEVKFLFNGTSLSEWC